MANNSLLSWFEKRRQSITLKLAQNQIMKVIDTATELERSIVAFSESKKLEAEKSIERLFIIEVEVDELRRSVFAELTKGTLPIKYREDLKSLVGRLDRLADYIKDAARSVKILIETDSVIYPEFLNIFIRMANMLVECTVLLSKSIEMLGVNTSQALDLANNVDTLEGKIDDDYLLAKASFIKNSEKANSPTFMVLKDLTDSIEQAADMCADTVDFIRVLAAGEV